MNLWTKTLLGLLLLSVIDALIPFPIVGAILIYVLIKRPPWFRGLVDEVYRR